MDPRLLDAEIAIRLNSTINELRKTAQFIDALRGATLEQSNMQQEDIDHLHTAEPDPRLNITDKHFCKALSAFLSVTNTSQKTYNMFSSCSSMLACYPDDPFLLYSQVKWCVKQLSGVVPIFYDMCPDTCIGFTGPFIDHECCPTCGKEHY